MNILVIIQLILVSIAATSAMTFFSYTMSKSFQELYKEPVLLTFALSKLKLDLSEKTKKTLAWLIHYFIGLLFVIGYHILWSKAILEISPFSAIVLGAASGIIGILSWMLIFKMTNHQPKIDFKGYYIQLFFAHVVFGLVATALYSIILTILILTNAYVTV